MITTFFELEEQWMLMECDDTIGPFVVLPVGEDIFARFVENCATKGLRRELEWGINTGRVEWNGWNATVASIFAAAANCIPILELAEPICDKTNAEIFEGAVENECLDAIQWLSWRNYDIGKYTTKAMRVREICRLIDENKIENAIILSNHLVISPAAGKRTKAAIIDAVMENGTVAACKWLRGWLGKDRMMDLARRANVEFMAKCYDGYRFPKGLRNGLLKVATTDAMREWVLTHE